MTTPRTAAPPELPREIAIAWDRLFGVLHRQRDDVRLLHADAVRELLNRYVDDLLIEQVAAEAAGEDLDHA